MTEEQKLKCQKYINPNVECDCELCLEEQKVKKVMSTPNQEENQLVCPLCLKPHCKHCKCEKCQGIPNPEETMEERFDKRFGDNFVWWRECLAEMQIGDPDFNSLKAFIRSELSLQHQKDCREFEETLKLWRPWFYGEIKDKDKKALLKDIIALEKMKKNI